MIRTTAIAMLLSSIVLQVTCWGQEKEKIALLLDRSPAPANAIAYINVPALHTLMQEAGFAGQPSTPIQELWFVAGFDFAAMRPKWEAGYAELDKTINAEQLASALGGYVDTVENHQVVHSPHQTYFIPGKEHPERLGILRPTDRSLLAGWLSPSINVRYTPFLDGQANQPEAYLSFMLAIDLKNVFSPIPLAARLQRLESLKSNPAESVANTLSSIEGFSVIVGRKSLQQCIVKFHFSSSPASLRLIAPELLAEILATNGLAAPEVKAWNVTVDENVLALQGPITQTTLSGLLSLFSMQSQAERAENRTSISESDKEVRAALQSKHYFDEVIAVVERTRDHKSKTSGAMASWNDKRARQIDELGTLDVDPELVQFGANVAELLRGNALSVQQTNIDAGKLKARQSLDYGYYDDYYGYYNLNDNTDYQRVTSAVARGTAYKDYRQALNQIDQLTAQIRRQMTEKYEMQF